MDGSVLHTVATQHGVSVILMGVAPIFTKFSGFHAESPARLLPGDGYRLRWPFAGYPIHPGRRHWRPAGRRVAAENGAEPV